MKFSVTENKFSEVDIDKNIQSENDEEDLIEVMNGCICCTVRGDLVVALKNLYKRVKQFDGVIIETTGLADPAPVCQTFFIDDDIKEMYNLDSVITVVDAKYILERLAEVKPEGVENEAVEQVAFADKILLNKIDLAKDEAELDKIEKALRKLNPTAPVQRTKESKINPKDILNLQAFELKRVLDFDPEFMDEDQTHEHDSSVVSLAVKVEKEVNFAMLENWVRRLIVDEGANLYRYKGVIAVRGMENKFIFQGVGMIFSGGSSDACWKKDEKRVSRFVFIGKNLDLDFYREGFMACCDDTLRFKVGDMVEVNVGTYRPGKVLKLWDDGNAYRVEIQEKRKVNVWAPIDNDVYIRLPKITEVE